MSTKVVVFAVVLFATLTALILVPDTPITGSKIILGSGGYDITVLQAPVTKGPLLPWLAYLLVKSPISPLLLRLMLNSNRVDMLRDLAAQVELAPLHYPMHRMSAQERQSHDQAASLPGTISLSQALQYGLSGNVEGELTHDGSDVLKYAKLYRDGITTPSNVLKKTLATIDSWRSEGFIIFSSLLPDDVLAQAMASDERFRNNASLSVFDGVPIAFKDSVYAVGHKIYEGTDPKDPLNGIQSVDDDIIVARFRQLGAIVLGVTVMVEGGVSPLGYNTHFHGPSNPYSTSRYSGGSSSGSAVVVGSGLVPIAIGFDGGGSIRIPATFSGVHGLAVTYGRIPFGNCMSSVIKSGPLAATAADAALALAVMGPNEPDHFYTTMYDGGVDGPPAVHLSGFNDVQNLSDVRIGVFADWFNDSDPAVRAACEAALSYLTARGATIVSITIPHLQWLSLSHGLKIFSEFSSLFDLHFHTHSASLESNTLISLGIGSTVSALEVLSGEQLRAYAFNYVRELFLRENLTAIATPTSPMVAPWLSDDAKQYGESNTVQVVKIVKYVFVANFLGLPAYSVPVGYADSSDGGPVERLPVGLQLMGLHWHEQDLLRLAHSIESGHTHSIPRKQPRYFHNAFDL